MEFNYGFLYKDTMSSLIYLTDGHYGPYIPANSPSGFTLLGEDAPKVRLAAQGYATANGIKTILDGGDQNSFEQHYDDPEEFEDYRTSTRRICGEFNEIGEYVTANGNHDFNDKKQQFHVPRESKLITPQDFKSTQILVLQPQSAYGDDGRYFYYDEDELRALLEDATATNLIMLAHWRLPLSPDSQPTNPQRKSPNLRGQFDQRTIGFLESRIYQGLKVLGLHGHSHYFQHDRTGLYPVLTMPSFVQVDQNADETLPCSLFAQIDETPSGLITRYKKVRFDPSTFRTISPPPHEVIDVTEAHMQRYAPRPYVEPPVGRLDWRQIRDGIDWPTGEPD